MNIVQIMPEFGLAGAEIMCENLTYELTKLGHKVTVISMYDFHSAITDRLEGAGIDVRYLGKKPGLDPSIIWKIKHILKETEAEIVHTHRYCAQYAVPAAMLAGVKRRVHTLHSIAAKENGRLARRLNHFFFSHCDLVPVALSEAVQETVVEEYGLKKEDIPVVFNGVDLSRCKSKDSYSVSGSFKVLHIGRFAEAKNHVGLVKAFGLFRKKYPDSELWLIGDGELKPEIERLVKESGLENCVKFKGLQSNVYGYLHDADIFTLPSNYEGIPMTLIEAMGTGLPIVATAVGGVPDMLTDGENACVVENDAQLIANAFEAYYVSKDMREHHGNKAKDRAIVFSAKTMAEKYVSVYNCDIN